jgi:hypothetical protein
VRLQPAKAGTHYRARIVHCNKERLDHLFALLQLSAWFMELFQFVPVDRHSGHSCDGFAIEPFQV